MNRPPNPTPPVYAPGKLSSEQAAANYRQGLAARAEAKKAGGLAKYTEQVAGGPGPSIPRLDAPFQQGKTMAEQAVDSVSAPQHAQIGNAMAAHAQNPNSIVEMPAGYEQYGRKPQAPQLHILPGDLLTDEAAKDPEFRGGAGSMLAQSQPVLAGKYGVMRNGQRVPPQALRAPQAPGQRSLSPETIEGLTAMNRSKQPAIEPTTTEHEAPVKPGTAFPGEGAEAKPQISNEAVEEAFNKLDEFDQSQILRQAQKDDINNPQQRKIIESRLGPLDIEDLIMKNRVSQEVPIIPGKLSITFQSSTGAEDLHLKRLLMQMQDDRKMTEGYMGDLYTFMLITCGVTHVNQRPVPFSHLDDNGKFDEKKFWEKHNWIVGRPLHLLALMAANYNWFEARVRKLFVMEKVGNG